MRVRRFKGILVFLLLTCAVHAQDRVDEAAVKAKYPGDDLYYVYDRNHLDITMTDGKPEITSEISGEIFLMNDKAKKYSEKSVYYYDELQALSNVEANSYVALGKDKYRKIKVTEMKTTHPVKNGVFYDDFQQMSFDYPSLNAGSYADYSYRIKYKDIHLVEPVFFMNNVGAGSIEYSVTFPRDVDVKYILYGDSAGIAFTRTESRHSITLTWVRKNVISLYQYSKHGEFRTIVPHIFVYIDSYTSNGIKVPVLSSTADLYHWFSTQMPDLSQPVDSSVKALANRLTANLHTDSDKIKAIYYWVQTNIRYVAFEYGLGGFIPRPASLVCDRKFGDCKDKANLLYALLNEAGFKAYHCWIGTDELPYKFSAIHLPEVANHMIIALYLENHWTFLDGTADYLPFGYPSAFIQGKEGLIGISKDSFAIVTVPVVKRELNYRSDTLNLALAGDSLVGLCSTTFGGLWRNSTVNNYSDDVKQVEIKEIFLFGNNKRKIDLLQCLGREGYGDTLQCSYKLTIPDYVRVIDDVSYINLNLETSFSGNEILTDEEKTDVKYKFRFEIHSVVSLALPAGYLVSYLPESASYSNKKFGYKITYHKSVDQIYAEKEFYMDTLAVTPADFAEWNKMIQSLGDAYANVVTIKKK